MKITKEELKQVIKEELSASIEEGASMKVPVEQYEDFKKRLEKFYTHYEKFSESMKYQLQSVYPNELKTSDPYSDEEDAKRKVRVKQIRGEFAKFNRQLHALDRHLADLLRQYNFKTEYWATQAMKARQDLALEEKK
jgi:predicted transcriptional regulator